MKKIIIFILIYLTITAKGYSSDSYSNQTNFKIEYFVDKTDKQSINQILNQSFLYENPKDLITCNSKFTYWLKISNNGFQNKKNDILFIDQPRIEVIESYTYKNGKLSKLKPYQSYLDSNSSLAKLFKIPDSLKKGDIIILKFRCKESLVLPVKIIDEKTLLKTISFRNLVFGLYTGIMIIMFAYNLFLYIVITDKSYLYYIFYILFTWLTQISIQGYTLKYFWHNTIFDRFSVLLFASFGLISSSFFILTFLNIKELSKRYYKLILLFLVLNIINVLISPIFGIYICFIIMQTLTVVGTIIALITASFVYFKKHFKPAGYYLVAWSVLLLGAILFVLKDYGIIPYNNFTIYLLQISSVIEVTLLSFALADKINFFKKQNEIAQANALAASLQNQELIQQQNVYLENNVKKRTEELQNANATLNVTLSNLKNAQSQLVDSEKMAALGQLTAGIAHEINNPINFVTSNIKPLELDVNDLKEVISKYEQIDPNKDVEEQLSKIEAFKKQIDIKFVNQEISSLLAGITEGAKRTAEIIRSLKNFSRVDETDIKPVDLNEGIKSTIILLRNSLPDNLKVITEYGNLPGVDCFPGKINQVFMNLISNAIHAIKHKEIQNEEEYLTIKTWYGNEKAYISIKDTGTGMTEETKHRIFEPFFTTKEIGEGTGLGLSIVFGIIEKHKGNIEVISTYGEGTEFIITLNINQK